MLGSTKIVRRSGEPVQGLPLKTKPDFTPQNWPVEETSTVLSTGRKMLPWPPVSPKMEAPFPLCYLTFFTCEL